MSMQLPQQSYSITTEQAEKMLLTFAPKQFTDESLIISFDEKKNPTLGRVNEVYGPETYNKLIKAHLLEPMMMCGFDFAGGFDMIVSTIARWILSDYPFLRIHQLDDFMRLFAEGTYGDLFGRFNSQKFFSSLKKYRQERLNGDNGLYEKHLNQ